MKNKILTVALAIALISSLVVGIANFISTANPAHAATPETGREKNTIRVSGSYTAKVEPDISYISIGVNTFAKNPKDAQKENAAKMDKVFEKLRDIGIAEKDIKTVNYSIYPRYEWNNIESTNEKGFIERKNEQVLVGYEVNNNISVTIRKLDLIGSVIDMTVDEGVNQANSISFGLSDEKREQYYINSLKKAVENAQGKAESIASMYNIKLDKPSDIIESDAYIPQPIPYRGMGEMAKMAMDSAASTPISAGEMEIRANVSVVYEY